MSLIRICDLCNKNIGEERYFSIPKKYKDNCLFDIEICVNCMEEIERKVIEARMESDGE